MFESNILIILSICAAVSSLVTEAIKKILGDTRVISADLLTAIVSVATAILVCIGYIILNAITITPQVIVYLVIVIVGSWLAATLGYDKVVETIGKILKK